MNRIKQAFKDRLWLGVIIVGLFAVVMLWFVLATYFSLKDSKCLKRIVIQNWIYFVVHFGYGWGYIVGIYKILFHRPFVVQVNR